MPIHSKFCNAYIRRARLALRLARNSFASWVQLQPGGCAANSMVYLTVLILSWWWIWWCSTVHPEAVLSLRHCLPGWLTTPKLNKVSERWKIINQLWSIDMESAVTYSALVVSLWSLNRSCVAHKNIGRLWWERPYIVRHFPSGPIEIWDHHTRPHVCFGIMISVTTQRDTGTAKPQQQVLHPRCASFAGVSGTSLTGTRQWYDTFPVQPRPHAPGGQPKEVSKLRSWLGSVH